MNLILLVVAALEASRVVLCTPNGDLKKIEPKRNNPSKMYHTLDITSQISRSLFVFDKKEINGVMYNDLTVKPGVSIDEIYDGDSEIWRAKPNRQLMKLMIIQERKSNTYIVLTKDKYDRLAETYILVTRVLLSFDPFMDLDYPLPENSPDSYQERAKNLRTAETQTEPQVKKPIKDPKAPFQNKEYMSDLLPNFVTKAKFREMEEDEKIKENSAGKDSGPK
uniref:Uncharacterized protein n=1 Tax=Theileria annulata TaxID=5874 RepID=A0A3B0MM41_THEAN